MKENMCTLGIRERNARFLGSMRNNKRRGCQFASEYEVSKVSKSRTIA